jgi:hypothetical protein
MPFVKGIMKDPNEKEAETQENICWHPEQKAGKIDERSLTFVRYLL